MPASGIVAAVEADTAAAAARQSVQLHVEAAAAGMAIAGASCEEGCTGKGNSLKWEHAWHLEEWLGLPCDWCWVSEWEESSVESAGE